MRAKRAAVRRVHCAVPRGLCEAACRLLPQGGCRIEIVLHEPPRPLSAPGVREETILRYKVNGSAEMTEIALVRARNVVRRCEVRPLMSLVRESSATVVSTAMCIPFERPESNSTALK